MKLTDKVKVKDDRHLDELHDSLAEAWLRRHFLTRLFRFLLTITVAVSVAITMNSISSTESSREDCMKRQQIYNVVESVLDGANQDGRYSDEVRIVRANLVVDCKQAYPQVWPLRYIID